MSARQDVVQAAWRSTASDSASPNTEQRLWQAVIANAFNEAFGTIVANGTNNQRAIRAGARSWLCEPTRDFVLVCHLAGFEPDRVHKRALQMLADVDAGREAIDLRPKRKRSTAGPRGPRAFRYAHSDGRTMTLKEWTAVSGIKLGTLSYRLSCGMNITDAVAKPINQKRKPKSARIPGGGHQLSKSAAGPAGVLHAPSDQIGEFQDPEQCR